MDLRRRLVVSIVLLALVVIGASSGYRFLTGGSWLDCIYMTVITLSTVGYGEVIPGLDRMPVGRIYTMFVVLAGMAILTYAVSTVTAFVVEGEMTNILRRRKMDKEIGKLSDHLIVCGCGRTGTHVVEELAAVGERFVVVEASRDHVERALGSVKFLYIVGDATDEHVLRAAGIDRARGVVTVLASDKDNLFVTFTARQVNPRLRIVSRAVDPTLRERLLRAGANGVVCPDQIGGLRMASELVRPHAVGFLDRMIRSKGDKLWRFEEVEVRGPAVGKTLGSLRILERVGLPILALTQEGRDVAYYPDPDTTLAESARLVVLGEKDQIQKLREIVAAGA